MQNILTLIFMAKYHKGQTVWGEGLGSKYIPQPYEITAVSERENFTEYRVKGKRALYSEDSLFATESEAQIALVSVFKADTYEYLKTFVDNSRRLGCTEQVRDFIFGSGQLLLGVYHEKENGFNTDRQNRPTPKFQVGQTVYGHVFRSDRSEYPKPLTLKSVNVVWYSEFGNVPAHWEVVYTAKRHGDCEIFETQIFKTEQEAILDALEGKKRSFKWVMTSFKQRSKALGVETQMRQALQSSTSNLMLKLL